MSEATVTRVLALVGNLGDISARKSFVNGLSQLIATYRVFKAQDRDTLRSEREAIDQLARATRKAHELVAAYRKACEYYHARLRMSAAWSHHQSTLPTHIGGVPIKYPGVPESLSERERDLFEFAEILSIAAEIPRLRSAKGGRPTSARAKHFVVEFRNLTRSTFALPLSLRRKPLKPLLELSFQEVGWHFEDIRPLLNGIEEPAKRKKPS